MTRCAIYTRKSTEEGLDQAFNSLDAQRLAGESFVQSQQHEGWQMIDKRYDDGGFSGATLDRPALQDLLTDVKAGLVNCIVVYKIDRLSRSLSDFSKLVDVFDQHNVTFVSVTQSFNTANSTGRLMLNMLLSFAQYEREVTRERTLDKIRSSKQKGIWMGGNVPLGYDVKNRELIINDKEAKLVRHIFDRFLALRSVTRLVNELNLHGYRTKLKGKSFTKGTVLYILTSPIYKGLIPHKDLLHNGLHEPLVSDELFEQVQAIFQKRSRATTNKSNALLQGIIRCKTCDTPMQPTFSAKKGKRYQYYACTNHLRLKECTAKHKTVAAGEVERFVVKQVQHILTQPEYIAEALRRLPNMNRVGDIGVIWDSLFPVEQQKICRMILQTVWFHDGGIDVEVKVDGLHLLEAS